MTSIARLLIECFKNGNKVIIFGNGGSLADASHFAAEFSKIPSVIALNDPVKITAIANDYGFGSVFALQVATLAKPGDIIIGLSSSGKSENVLMALLLAKKVGLTTIDFPRKGKTTQDVQNYQYKLLHKIYLEVKENL